MRFTRLRVAAAALATLVLAPGATAANGHANYHAVCPGAENDAARCHAQVVTDERGTPNATTSPTGLGPADFVAAYKLGTGGVGQTIGIVDAYDDPTAESDLAVYSSTYGLPPCTTANGCFQKVKQAGKVRTDQGWALEISLDVQTAHAICPVCKILLVEAKTNSFTNLMSAVDYAAAHATVVSNSYGASESSGETAYDSHFNHPGIPITVSSGDSGYAVEYPAASQYVTAVGGTTLHQDPVTGVWGSETAWSGAGSGCSLYEPKPAWQPAESCGGRLVADVSADADPASGASVYDSTPYNGATGWFKVGGTSLAAPLVAGVYALAGNGAATTYGSYPYSHTSFLNDITSGSNGTSCPVFSWCNAGTGWDGPTGLGTPNGVAGF